MSGNGIMDDLGYKKPEYEDILSEIKQNQEMLGYNQQTLINMLADFKKEFKEIKELANEFIKQRTDNKTE